MRFQDGTPVDAEAVVFSFERQIVPEHPHHEPDFVWTRAYHYIRRVRADGPLRVQFEIDRVPNHHTGGLYGDGRGWFASARNLLLLPRHLA